MMKRILLVLLSTGFLVASGSLDRAGFAQTDQEEVQEPITVDRVIRKIDQKRPELKKLSAHVDLRAYENGEQEEELRLAGTIKHREDTFFRLLVSMNVPVEDQLWGSVLDQVAQPDRRSYQFHWFGDEVSLSGGFFRSYDSDVQFDDTGMINGLLEAAGEISFLPVLEHNLFPASLRSYRSDDGLNEVERSGTTYVVLEKTRTWRTFGPKIHKLSLTHKLFFNRKTSRIERASLVFKNENRSRRVEMIMKVHDRTVVSGISLPNEITLTTYSNYYSERGKLEQDGRLEGRLTDIRVNEAASDVRVPSWLDDPALTEYRPQDVEKTRQQVKKHPDQPRRYSHHVAAVIQQLDEKIRNGKFREVRTYPRKLQSIFAKVKDLSSELLQAQKTVLQLMTGRRDSIKQTAKKMLEEGKMAPAPLFAAAMIHLREEEFDAAKTYLQPLADVERFRWLVREHLTKLKIEHSGTGKELLSTLEDIFSDTSGKADIRHKMNLVQSPSPNDEANLLSEKSFKTLRNLHRNTSNQYVLMLLARAYRAKLQNVENSTSLEKRVWADKLVDLVHEIYLNASSSTLFKQERERFVRRMPEKVSLALFEKLETEIDTPRLLLHYANRHLEAGNRQQAIRLMETFHSALETSGEQVSIRLPDHQPSRPVMQKMIDALHSEGKRDLVTTIMITIVQKGNPSDLLKLLDRNPKTYLGSDAEDVYRIVRFIKSKGNLNKFADPETMMAVLRQRIEDGKADDTDYRFLRRLVRWGVVDLSSSKSGRRSRFLMNALRTAKKRSTSAEEQLVIRERMGDVRFMSGDAMGAAEDYFFTASRRMELMRSGDRERKWFLKQMLGDGSAGEVRTRVSVRLDRKKERTSSSTDLTFHPGRSIVEKLVKAHLEAGTPQKAVDQIDRFTSFVLEDVPSAKPSFSSPGMSGFCSRLVKVYLVLEQEEQVDRLLKQYLTSEFNNDEQRARRAFFSGYTFGRRVVQLLKKHGEYLKGFLFADYMLNRIGRTLEGLEKQKNRLREKVDFQEEIRFFLNEMDAPEVEQEKKDRMQRLINQLGSPDFEKRKRAQEGLREIGPVAAPFLKSKRDASNPEVRNRVQELLKSFLMDRLRERILPDGDRSEKEQK